MSDVNTQQVDQFREFSKIYNTMSEICFNQCVWDFGTEEVRTRRRKSKTNFVNIHFRYEIERTDVL